jgi:hypothetical protein
MLVDKNACDRAVVEAQKGHKGHIYFDWKGEFLWW